MWWTRQGSLIMPLNHIQQKPRGMCTSSKAWDTALYPPANSSIGPFTFFCTWDWDLPLPRHWGGWGKASSCSVRSMAAETKGPEERIPLGRNVLGCRWETESHPRRQSWWKRSWHKYAELIKTGDPYVEWGRWHEWKLFQHCCQNRMWKSCINIFDFLRSHLNRKKVLTPFLKPLRRWTYTPVFWEDLGFILIVLG